jgi:hypothetical protein
VTSPHASVLKVGGSVLRDAAAYRAIAGRLGEEVRRGPVWIVVSAGAGVTDLLVALRGAETVDQRLEALLERHRQLAGTPPDAALREDLEQGRIESRAGNPARLLSWGERASSSTLRSELAVLGHPMPVRELPWEGAIRGEPSALVPGFYLRDAGGGLHLLPRGGGDLSAVLVASRAGARVVRFWKDGGGIRLGGVAVGRIGAEALLPKLTDPLRPLHAGAVRLASRLGIDLQLEDPAGEGPTTRIIAAGSLSGPGSEGRSELGPGPAVPERRGVAAPLRSSRRPAAGRD